MLINFARPFIYTTALPLSAYDRMLKATEVRDMNQLQHDLQHRIAYFREKSAGLVQSDSEINSPIQFVRFADLNRLIQVEKALKEAQVFAKAIYSPTVPEGSEGLRISLHSYNTFEEIDRLIRVLSA